MLRVEHISLQAGAFRLRDVCLSVGPREYFVLMGQTGSGKTLLIESIAGLLKPAGGKIFIDDEDVTELAPRHRHIGYVPQNSGLFPHLTVLRNITFPLQVGGMGRREAAGDSHVAEIIESLGVGALLDRTPIRLSGGERQKVALARALVKRPKLLVLDEPVSALDGPTRDEICAVLQRVQKEFAVTTIHVCHNLAEARTLADRVGVMHQGQLVQAGPLDELSKNPQTDAVTRLVNGKS
jgi:ABC-type sugar transport system ATPase subunit